jgi:S1-C subfamily serine protease
VRRIAWLMACLMAAVLAGGAAPIAAAQSAAATPPSAPQAERALDALQAEVAELRRKVEKPPKDIWDKVTAVSGVASGLAVALIGFYATNVYNRRQRSSDERRKDQELKVSQVQAVERFIPHLSSKEENTKAAALIALSSLVNEELAVKLAITFGGQGATAALAGIAAVSGPEGGASAKRALRDQLFSSLQARMVTVHGENGRLVGSGFMVDIHGLAVTPFHVGALSFRDGALRPSGALVRHRGKSAGANVLTGTAASGLALLQLELPEEPRPLVEIPQSTVDVGERVIALFIDERGEPRIKVGSVQGYYGLSQLIQNEETEEPRPVVLLSHSVSRSAAGSPVINSSGNLVGLIYKAMGDVVALIPIRDVVSFVTDARKHPEVQRIQLGWEI